MPMRALKKITTQNRNEVTQTCTRCEPIQQQYDALAKKHARLEERLHTQTMDIEHLKGHIKELEGRLKKDSNNSNKPPSSDGLRKPSPKSRRGRSGKPSGGQSGHPGSTLKAVATPDTIQTHDVAVCAHCQCSLKEVAPIRWEQRQVFELPALTVEVTAHQVAVKGVLPASLCSEIKI